MKKKGRYIGEVIRHYAALLVISVFRFAALLLDDRNGGKT